MKNILITGKGSYIGTHFKEYMKQWPDQYQVDELDMMDPAWVDHDFSKYDVVYHVAGIAHQKETDSNKNLYQKVNCNLAIEVARVAKKSGIQQFIFMSSMSVYGLNYSKEPINLQTECKPTTYYGKSKLNAEKQLMELADGTFQLCILRPPMVYGEDSPGNLTKLFNMVKKIHIFPTIKNQRSSITIACLVKYVKDYIDSNAGGIYLPQNDEYMCTYEIVKIQMTKNHVKVIYLSIFNPIIRLLIGRNNLITKCFGDLIYER